MSTVQAEKPAKLVVLQQLTAEREELVELCSQLRPDEWNKPSLCEGWRVRDVLAHVVGTQTDLLLYFTSGGPNKANEKMVTNRREISTEALVSQLVSAVRPKGVSKLVPMIPLLDTWVHQQDMRWVLGPERQRQQDPTRLRLLLNFLGRGVEKKKRGYQYKATDLDWQAGKGPLISGPAEAILMALIRRPAALERLNGPGVAALAERWKSQAR